MMRWLFLALAVTSIAEPARAGDGQPYGCWSISDDVERLACFDMALGPPAATPDAQAPDPMSGSGHNPLNQEAEPKRSEAR